MRRGQTRRKSAHSPTSSSASFALLWSVSAWLRLGSSDSPSGQRSMAPDGGGFAGGGGSRCLLQPRRHLPGNGLKHVVLQFSKHPDLRGRVRDSSGRTLGNWSHSGFSPPRSVCPMTSAGRVRPRRRPARLGATAYGSRCSSRWRFGLPIGATCLGRCGGRFSGRATPPSSTRQTPTCSHAGDRKAARSGPGRYRCIPVLLASRQLAARGAPVWLRLAGQQG